LAHLPACRLHDVGRADAAVRKHSPSAAYGRDRFLLCKGSIRRTKTGISDWPPWATKPNPASGPEFDVEIVTDKTNVRRPERIDRQPNVDGVVLGVEAVQVDASSLRGQDD
jgi:hypothetical protein